MPIHDWSRVDAGIFHDLHLGWIHEMRAALNERLLPEPFYALAEPVLGETVPDVLTLKEAEEEPFLEGAALERAVYDDSVGEPVVSTRSSVVVQDLSPPDAYAALARRIVIKSSLRDDQVVAVIELVSRANKVSKAERERFVTKSAELLRHGVHMVVVVVQPGTKLVSDGFHALICDARGDSPTVLPEGHPLQAVSYQVLEDGSVRSHLVPLKVGDELPDMPVFLTSHRYVRIPLEETYERAFRAVPRRFQRELEE